MSLGHLLAIFLNMSETSEEKQAWQGTHKLLDQLVVY